MVLLASDHILVNKNLKEAQSDLVNTQDMSPDVAIITLLITLETDANDGKLWDI